MSCDLLRARSATVPKTGDGARGLTHRERVMPNVSWQPCASTRPARSNCDIQTGGWATYHRALQLDGDTHWEPLRCSRRCKRADNRGMAQTATTIAATAATMQQILDRAYPRLAWRVLASPTSSCEHHGDAWVLVHARTRDLPRRCRVGRPGARLNAGPPCASLVAERAAAAERALAQQAAP